MTNIPKILLIYTGGTIGMIRDYNTNALRAFNFESLKSKIPELNLLDCEIETIEFDTPLDSSNMSHNEWSRTAQIILENYERKDGFVILTGTDTMSYMSSALSFMLENLQKPVIFTGSQLPIGDLRTDAKENLITAIQIASAQKDDVSIIQEVGLYFEYKLYRANRTTKMSSEQFDAFHSPNYPELAESGVHLKFNYEVLFRPIPNQNLNVRNNFDDNIISIRLFPGMRKEVISSIFNIPNLKGIIIETYGAGNAPTHDWFIEIIEKSIRKGIPVINVTQCKKGRVLMGLYDASSTMKKIGVINGADITIESAIAKLKYLLGLKVGKQEFKTLFEKPLRGEMTYQQNH